MEEIMRKGFMPVIICSGSLRPYLRKTIERSLPGIMVLSYEELVDDIPFRIEAVVSV